jgi:hypothetical protein
MGLGCLVDELIERERDEVDEHDLDHGRSRASRAPIAAPQTAPR